MKSANKFAQHYLRLSFLALATASFGVSVFFGESIRAPQVEAEPIFSGNLPPASSTPKPTLPPIKLSTMPVQQAISMLEEEVNSLQEQVNSLKAQTTQLEAQSIVQNNQANAAIVALQSQINSLKPTPRPPGSLIGPGIIQWYSLRMNMGNPNYDNMLIPFYTNPNQQFITPGGGSATEIPLEHRLPAPTPSS